MAQAHARTALIRVRKAVPTSNAPFPHFACLGVREDDMLDRWVGVVVSWIEGRDVERAIEAGEEVVLEVPAHSWYFLFAHVQAA